MKQTLLTRDQFRTGVFQRDEYKCVICKAAGQDAHHIIERRLFHDGGYYIDNGATLCSSCHIRAEQTILSTDEIRKAAGITHIILPEHAYSDQQYDKWLNPVLANGMRVRGELFEDLSVQKILEPVLHLFTNRVKYNRTNHLPWSKGLTKDDRMLEECDLILWNNTEVVITEKRDGEQSNLYKDGLHARSVDVVSHPSRNRLKALHSKISHNIPDNWRICGENMSAKHSIHYINLKTFFEVFSIWNGLSCLSWDDTVTYTQLLGLETVPILWRGIWNENIKKNCINNTLFENNSIDEVEGYVVRPCASFSYKDFRKVVGKFVRANHIVKTRHHWFNSKIVWNKYKNE